MLLLLILFIALLWALGFFSGVGGSLVHLLLLLIVIVIVIRVLQGRRL